MFAAGPWLPELFPAQLGDLVRVTRQDVLYVGPSAGDDRFDGAHLPTWVDYDGAWFGIPGIDGRAPKIGSDSYGPPFDPSTGERVVDPASVDAAREYLRRRLPGLADGPVVETRVCQYETTPDTQFIIDRHPELDNVWIVGGGSGHGFKHGPRIGEYVVERLLGAQAESRRGALLADPSTRRAARPAERLERGLSRSETAPALAVRTLGAGNLVPADRPAGARVAATCGRSGSGSRSPTRRRRHPCRAPSGPRSSGRQPRSRR